VCSLTVIYLVILTFSLRMVADAAKPRAKQSTIHQAKARREEMIKRAEAEAAKHAEAEKAKQKEAQDGSS